MAAKEIAIAACCFFSSFCPLAGAAPMGASFIPKKIVSGLTHTCVTSSLGQLKCWGLNATGQLDAGPFEGFGRYTGSMGDQLPLVDLGKNFYVKDICAGGFFSCALSNAGGLKCWGANYSGELGQEHSDPFVGTLAGHRGDSLPFTKIGSDFHPIEIQCGESTACALNAKGQMKCWGQNVNLEMGRPLVPLRFHLGDQPGDMAEQLPFTSIPPVKSFAVGGHHVCAATSQDIRCWGNNSMGQIGIESSINLLELPFDSSDTTVKVKLEEPGVSTFIHRIFSGSYHSCAEYALAGEQTKKFKCWGSNLSGEVGIGSSELKIGKTAGSMGANLLELQLPSKEFVQFEAYNSFSCGLKKNGSVQCWGSNRDGELGQGDKVQRGSKPSDLGNNLLPVNLGLPALALSHGPIARHVCALLINHEIKCWGWGENGQLGYEDGQSRGVKIGEMGENLPYVRFR